MNAIHKAAVLCTAGLGIALSIPASAQNYPTTNGDYVTMTSITVDDGHGLDYARLRTH